MKLFSESTLWVKMRCLYHQELSLTLVIRIGRDPLFAFITQNASIEPKKLIKNPSK